MPSDFPWHAGVSIKTHNENSIQDRFEHVFDSLLEENHAKPAYIEGHPLDESFEGSLLSSKDSGYRSRSTTPVATSIATATVLYEDRGKLDFSRTQNFAPFLMYADTPRDSIIFDNPFSPYQSNLPPLMVTRVPGSNQGNQAVVKSRCLHPDCGRLFKNLEAHMLTRQSERPEKCPIESCEWHRKGFVRKYDRNRHTLTHFKGKLVCIFCPGAGSASQTSFNRADVFKRHLISVHGAEPTPPHTRKKVMTVPQNSSSATVVTEGGKCSSCFVTIYNAQEFYEHVDLCVLLHVLQGQGSSQAIDQQQSTESTRAPKEIKDVQQSAGTNNKAVFGDSSVRQLDGAKKDGMDSGDWNSPYRAASSLETSHKRSVSEAQMTTRELAKSSGSDHAEPADIAPMRVSHKFFKPDQSQVLSIPTMHNEGSLKATAGLEEVLSQDYDRTPSITSGSESDESQHSIIHNSFEIAVLHSRHQMMAKCMQEVYAIFDQLWAPNTRTHATSASDSGLQNSQSTESAVTSGGARGVKRRRGDRDTSPPDGRRRKRIDNSETPLAVDDESQPFACPLHKYDPEKYSCNNITGSKFRACMGPGFPTIARLK